MRLRESATSIAASSAIEKLMLKIKRTASALLAIGVPVGIIIAAWFSLRYFVRSLVATDPQIAAAIIAAMATVLVGIAVAAYSQRASRISRSEEAHRGKKVEIYKAFVDVFARQLANNNTHVHLKTLKQQELVQLLYKFKTDLLLWGSPGVIMAYQDFEHASNKNMDPFTAMNNLYLEIRKDIGLSNAGLRKHDLVKMYLSNPDELDAFLEAPRTAGAADSK